MNTKERVTNTVNPQEIYRCRALSKVGVGEGAKRPSCLRGAHSGENSQASLEGRDKAKKEPVWVRGVRREVREIFLENSFLSEILKNGRDFSRFRRRGAGVEWGRVGFCKKWKQKERIRVGEWQVSVSAIENCGSARTGGWRRRWGKFVKGLVGG